MRKPIVIASLAGFALFASMTLASASQRRSSGTALIKNVFSAGSRTAVAASSHDQRLVLTTRNEIVTPIDTGPQGESVGDEIVVTSSLYKGDHKVGRFDAHAVFTLPGRALVTATSTVRGSEITASGVIDFTRQGPLLLPIVGGTKGWDTIGGQVQAVPLTETSDKFIYDIDQLD